MPTIKIVFVITGTAIGGAQSMLLKVIERLPDDFSSHVFSLTPILEVGESIRSMGVPVESFDMVPGRINLVAFWRMKQRLREIAPDVVHTWMYHADLLGGLAARLAGVPAIAWCIRHGDPRQGIGNQITLGVVRTCALFSSCVPDKILCCSNMARQVHVETGYDANKFLVIPNGFDIARFKPDESARSSVREELGLAPETQLVGLLGRFHLQKNYTGFIEAAARLHNQRPAVHFVLAGSGIEESNRALIEPIVASGLSQVMHLLGPRHDVPRLMAALDVMASSSIDEAFPNVLGEAMACGVPCAVTDVGDSASIVGDTGRVVASGDMSGLARSMEALLALPIEERKTLGERARARVVEQFEIGAVVKRYEEFYRELADTGRAKKSKRKTGEAS